MADLATELGTQWREAQDTRAQFGVGDTIVWFEEHPQDIIIEPINITATKTFTGSVFTLTRHLLGSWHPYQTSARLALGSFHDGAEDDSGSIALHAGSTSGSWISPRLRYSLTEEYDSEGNITDATTTWRDLTYDYSGSVLFKFIDYLTDTVVGSLDISANGSIDCAGLPFFERDKDIILGVELGGAGAWVGSLFLAFKPATLGSSVTFGPRFAEHKVRIDFQEDFSSLGSIDTGSSTGSLFYLENQEYTEDFSTTDNKGDCTAYWDTSTEKLRMSSNPSHGNFYSNYCNVGSFTNLGSMYKQVTINPQENKWGTDVIEYFVSLTGEGGPYAQVTPGIVTEVASGSEPFCKVFMYGNGGYDTYLGSLDVTLYTGSSNGYILYPGTQVQSQNLSSDWSLTNFDRMTLNATGSNLVGSLTFYVSSANSDTFVECERSIEETIATIGSISKWKAVYNLDAGSSLLRTVDLIIKGEDY